MRHLWLCCYVAAAYLSSPTLRRIQRHRRRLLQRHPLNTTDVPRVVARLRRLDMEEMHHLLTGNLE